ncbi:tyrosine-protein phosphatase [Pediococcus claussenii]|uniref:Protein-tyrosine phosphatase n=1 Tax=Pediococcus claussenii (strain ATCC BAA-344 / DSM 14800 / JCM 18046 / KCTC 3811 / LMG 21948 / P06) TaxID=701521 RepID=G8PB66_PEDCP|nr:tyrosine-protein phosphatase [Pediococcus claussenii]AEV94695.1 protein-tyrosine phosphatase [Pediococcus claussenii ATCC BAA-344]ANZ69890.1 protein tyrosine phosphatase [Pediococcus claussenii]ANZ71707.1 protein tyrosine phosphatase [Pediococcus claussenii]KRN20874.1 ptp protein [Pediococcus claussenii]
MKEERILKVPGAINFRELGGYKNLNNQTIKWHKLLRSGELSRLNDQALWNLHEYGLRFDIDLRSPAEVKWSADRVFNDVTYRSYPVYPIRPNEKSDIPANLSLKLSMEGNFYDPYIMMVLGDHSRLAFRAMFDDMLANNSEHHSLLFHCAAGKDRTGVAAMMVLSALQVPYETIRQDYLLTNVIYGSRDQDDVRNQLTNKRIDSLINQMNSVFTVEATNLDNANNAVLKRFGDWDHYFTEGLALSKSDLTDLRKIYLE